MCAKTDETTGNEEEVKLIDEDKIAMKNLAYDFLASQGMDAETITSMLDEDNINKAKVYQGIVGTCRMLTTLDEMRIELLSYASQVSLNRCATANIIAVKTSKMASEYLGNCNSYEEGFGLIAAMCLRMISNLMRVLKEKLPDVGGEDDES